MRTGLNIIVNLLVVKEENMKKKLMTSLKRIIVAACIATTFVTALPIEAKAETNTPSYTDIQNTTELDGDRIDDTDRTNADNTLYYYMNSLTVQYNLNSVQLKKLNDVFNSAVYYIANTTMTKKQLETYVATTQTAMNNAATSTTTQETDQYLQVADNWSTPTVSYGQRVSIVLPIVNIGSTELKNLVIEPEVTTDVKTWPFEPESTGYIQTEPFIPGYVNDDQAFTNRREFTYNFVVRDDVMTGFYELKFKVSYTIAGERVEESKAAELSVYVQTIGKPESGYIGGNGNEAKTSKSRIIVTGYETDTDKVYSGDTFNLTIHVQNTSSDTAVSNVLFNVVSQKESTGTANTSDTITPFLPTSGSNSIYLEKIGPKQTADLKIEMSAKPGLSQKSYVLDLKMIYDSGMQFDLEDTASISIPVYQESKFDISNPEISPASINVGSQSNIMFSIYNTGKTTLYNVQVQFSADSIENNMAFVGNLTSGSTGNVDVMLSGVAATMDTGDINMSISYEDEAGNKSTIDKTITLFVNEEIIDDYNDGRRDEFEVEEEKDNGTLIRIIIIVVILLIIIAIVIFVINRTKKKKEAQLANEDLMDLEALDEEESEQETEKASEQPQKKDEDNSETSKDTNSDSKDERKTESTSHSSDYIDFI